MTKIINNKQGFNQARAIIKDLLFKENYNKYNSREIKIYKLLKAREENIDFEIELAERICGDNAKYPYRSSFYLTKYFNDLGYTYTHTNSTRRFWVQEILLELPIEEIANIIEKGLFRRKDYENIKLRSESNKTLTTQEFLNGAVYDFKEFIDNSINANETVSLIDILDININIELLYENKAKTSDNELNKLIEEAKTRFLIPNDKYIALEKLWDAFERLKTYYDKDKMQSANRLLDLISENFELNHFKNEFKLLTEIGNNYRIRHHETNKHEISDIRHVNYLFFRMLSLIDLCINYLNQEVD